ALANLSRLKFFLNIQIITGRKIITTMNYMITFISFLSVIVVVVTMLLYTADGWRHKVGNNLGWTLPPKSSTYSTWASHRRFRINDILGDPENDHGVAASCKPSFSLALPRKVHSAVIQGS
ncbi:Cupredoxin, partial [Parasponia andersonii]